MRECCDIFIYRKQGHTLDRKALRNAGVRTDAILRKTMKTETHSLLKPKLLSAKARWIERFVY